MRPQGTSPDPHDRDVSPWGQVSGFEVGVTGANAGDAIYFDRTGFESTATATATK